jgi:hypothetical protein
MEAATLAYQSRATHDPEVENEESGRQSRGAAVTRADQKGEKMEGKAWNRLRHEGEHVSEVLMGDGHPAPRA